MNKALLKVTITDDNCPGFLNFAPPPTLIEQLDSNQVPYIANEEIGASRRGLIAILSLPQHQHILTSVLSKTAHNQAIEVSIAYLPSEINWHNAKE